MKDEGVFCFEAAAKAGKSGLAELIDTLLEKNPGLKGSADCLLAEEQFSAH